MDILQISTVGTVLRKLIMSKKIETKTREEG